MIRGFWATAFLCIGTLAMLVGCDSSGSGSEPTVADALQAAINTAGDANTIRGLSAAVIVPGQDPWLGVYGSSTEGEPITTGMFFGIASITKNYVAALTLKLVDEGLLVLDDPVSKWLPAIDNVDPAITLRQLLNHTSGLANYTENPALFDFVFSDPSKIRTPEEVLTLVEAPIATPGATWYYSNTNFILLGLVIQEATQASVSANLRDRLLGPLGLNQTFLEVEEQRPGTRATPWADLNNDGALEDISDLPRESLYSAAWTAGALVATAENTALWTKALFEGDVLSQASLDEMLSFNSPVSHPAAMGYGLGTMTFASSHATSWGHTGDIFGYASITMYVPENQISIAVLANQGLDESVKIAIANDLLDAVLQAQ